MRFEIIYVPDSRHVKGEKNGEESFHVNKEAQLDEYLNLLLHYRKTNSQGGSVVMICFAFHIITLFFSYGKKWRPSQVLSPREMCFPFLNVFYVENREMTENELSFEGNKKTEFRHRKESFFYQIF